MNRNRQGGRGRAETCKGRTQTARSAKGARDGLCPRGTGAAPREQRERRAGNDGRRGGLPDEERKGTNRNAKGAPRRRASALCCNDVYAGTAVPATAGRAVRAAGAGKPRHPGAVRPATVCGRRRGSHAVAGKGWRVWNVGRGSGPCSGEGWLRFDIMA